MFLFRDRPLSHLNFLVLHWHRVMQVLLRRNVFGRFLLWCWVYGLVAELCDTVKAL
jgi:hypothetical protein